MKDAFFCSIGQVLEERQHHQTRIKLYGRMIKKAGGFSAGKGILKKKGPAGINLTGPFYCGGVKMFIVDTHTLCTYNIIMKFEWDEKKRQTNINIIKHRIDFTDAIELFKGPSLILEDNRRIMVKKDILLLG